MIRRLGQDTQTMHAELMALLLADPGRGHWWQLDGSFVRKVVKGIRYVYFQYSLPGGGKLQVAVGAASPEVDAIVAAYETGRRERDGDQERIGRLASMLSASGHRRVTHAVARVLKALADAGVFRLGGVLVGTHAFRLLGDLLGVEWPEGTWTTEDIDVAGRSESGHELDIEVATPRLEADVPSALENLHMGFVPVPAFDPDHPSTSFKVRGKQLRVDLLTPGSDREQAPVYIPRFRAAAAPIKHLSLLLQQPVPAAAVNGGAVLVAVPQPAAFALHKLLVSQTRSLVQQTKVVKDLQQAALLLEVLAEDRPDDLEEACAAFRAAGPSVVAKVVRGAKAAAKRHPEGATAVDVVTAALG
jgi:hypothetical protein